MELTQKSMGGQIIDFQDVKSDFDPFLSLCFIYSCMYTRSFTYFESM